jgi:hypothetical protein
MGNMDTVGIAIMRMTFTACGHRVKLFVNGGTVPYERTFDTDCPSCHIPILDAKYADRFNSYLFRMALLCSNIHAQPDEDNMWVRSGLQAIHRQHGSVNFTSVEVAKLIEQYGEDAVRQAWSNIVMGVITPQAPS